MFKKEVERLVLLRFLDLVKKSEWGYPSFAQPKPKTNWLCFLRDFRNKNKKLKRKPYPMPNIN